MRVKSNFFKQAFGSCVILACTVLFAGCFQNAHPIRLASHTKGVSLTAKEKKTRQELSQTELTVKVGRNRKKIYFDDMYEALAISPDASLVGLMTCERGCPYGPCLQSYVHIVDTETFQKKAVFAVDLKYERPGYPGYWGHVNDEMYFDNQAKRLIILSSVTGGFYDTVNPSSGADILSLWNIETGERIYEICIPQPEPNFPNPGYLGTHLIGIYDFKFSPDGNYMALYGSYNAHVYSLSKNHPQYFPKPIGVIMIWSATDGKLVIRKPKIPIQKFLGFFDEQKNKIAWVEENGKPYVKAPDGSLIALSDQ